MRCYPKVIVKGQSFYGVKKKVVPNQSMTLKDIIKRFIKHESLPVIKEGFFAETDGDVDLEKFVHEDPTVKHDILQQQKERVKGHKAKADDEHKSAMQKAREAKKAEQEELYQRLKREGTGDPHPPNP